MSQIVLFLLDKSNNTKEEISIIKPTTYKEMLLYIRLNLKSIPDNFEMFILGKNNEEIKIDNEVKYKLIEDIIFIREIDNDKLEQSLFDINYNQLSELEKEKLEEKYNCILCSIIIKKEKPYFCYKCQNIFHEKCLKDWDNKCKLQKKELFCPNCRNELPIEQWNKKLDYENNRKVDANLLNQVNELKDNEKILFEIIKKYEKYIEKTILIFKDVLEKINTLHKLLNLKNNIELNNLINAFPLSIHYLDIDDISNMIKEELNKFINKISNIPQINLSLNINQINSFNNIDEDDFNIIHEENKLNSNEDMSVGQKNILNESKKVKSSKNFEESKENKKPSDSIKLSVNEINPQIVHLSPFNRSITYIHDFNYLLTKKTNHGVCGSHNLGNTCYMNSSIACLSNCTELTAYFLTGKYKTSINKKSKQGLQGELANAWYELLKDYWETELRIGDPSKVKLTIAKKVKIFRGFNQQDSDEFTIEFLSLLNEDLNKSDKKEYKELKKKGKYENDIECAKRFWNSHLERNDSIITDLFCGLLKSDIKCNECGFVNITFDPFNSLTLAIPSSEYLSDKLTTHFDTQLFYIPKYCIGKNLKISLHVPKEIEYKDLPEEIKKIKDFPYKFDKLLFVKVLDSEFKGFVGPFEKKSNQIECIFAFDDLRKEENTKAIPLYMFNDQVISAFPRILFLKDTTTFGELKKYIYFYARSFLRNSLANSKDEIEQKNDVDKKINLNKDKKNKIKEIFDLMDKEYNQIFGTHKSKEKLYIFKDFPYIISLKKKFDDKDNLILFDGDNNLKNLEEFNITKDEDSIASLIQDTDFCLNLILLPNSSFSIPKLSLNSCATFKGEDVGKGKIDISKINLDDLLKYFCSNENLDYGNEWKCENCKKRVKTTKKLSIFCAPQLLIIYLKRFVKTGLGNRDYSKNNILIDFPIENLDMGKYICGPDKAYSKYDLFAVNQHYGGIGGGHYTAVCKNIDGNWYSYDGSSVSTTPASKAISSAAYVLFYRRKNL